MSRFSVLVVGDNIKDQLQPFHEFECTGTDHQYVKDVDITAEVLALALEDVELVEPLALEDVELVEPLAPENRPAAIEDYWRLNAEDLARPEDEARLLALYDAAITDGLELPYERRNEVQACTTTRVAAALAGGGASVRFAAGGAP